MMTQLFPSDVFWSIPRYPHPGAFGGPRTHDLHTGVDLYVPEGTPVYAMADGTVMDVSLFTGPNANPPCPWRSCRRAPVHPSRWCAARFHP